MKGIKIPNINALGFYLRIFAYDIYNTHTHTHSHAHTYSRIHTHKTLKRFINIFLL